jgi:hypothetical protein
VWPGPAHFKRKKGSPAWGIPDGARPLGSGQSAGSFAAEHCCNTRRAVFVPKDRFRDFLAIALQKGAPHRQLGLKSMLGSKRVPSTPARTNAFDRFGLFPGHKSRPRRSGPGSPDTGRG